MRHLGLGRAIAHLAVTLVFIATMGGTAAAFDLSSASRDGDRLARALDAGRKGNWRQADSIAGESGDLLVRDLVTWRKLHAGRGSFEEYNSLVSRRGRWPGHDRLAVEHFGARPDTGSDGMTSRSRQLWSAFSRRWNRKQYDEAESYLASITEVESNLGNPERWADRRAALARRAARLGRPEVGYLLASQHYLTSEAGYDYAELEWLAGWVALRMMADPAAAVVHFEAFLTAVETPISLGRGGYWLGKAQEAAGNPDAAARAYRIAAVHQTSFYGQLAAERLGLAGSPRLVMGELPDWERSPAVRSDDVRAAVLLHYAGETAFARRFFIVLGKTMEGKAALGALADLALALDRPNYAVRLAKTAARRGILLYPAYYPLTDLAEYAGVVEPAFAMSVARQETELDPRAVSPAGARGLMQLMPRTAKRVAQWIGEPYSLARLTDDWQYNARLGQTYLARRRDQFGGSYVMAAAAYNAGAHRVDRWVEEFGDPRGAEVDMIDWIEMIPFDETRNYVQRVMEGLYVYRSRLTGVAGPMTLGADLARGTGRQGG
ncbi:MAG: lytic transglycosylase domain-containing protein [Pseudomonadota bacterium]